MDQSFQPETQEAVSWHTVSEALQVVHESRPREPCKCNARTSQWWLRGDCVLGLKRQKTLPQAKKLFGTTGWEVNIGNADQVRLHSLSLKLCPQVYCLTFLRQHWLFQCTCPPSFFFTYQQWQTVSRWYFSPNRIGANQTNRGGKNTWIILCLVATKYSPLLNLVGHLNFNFRP